MIIIYEKGDKCPLCNSTLEEVSYGEDEAIYIECVENETHYSRYIGLLDDLTE